MVSRNMWRKLTSLVLAIAIALLFSHQVWADRMGSNNYNLLFTTVDIGGGTTSSTNYTIDVSLGQTAAKKWAENGYIVKAGFQYVHVLYPFSFELSDTTLDFGTLLPNTPVTEQLTATVNHRGQGYEVKVYEDHKLQTFDGSAWIDDTVCDGPNCTATNAEVWDLPGTYGFGYNVSGHDVSPDFEGLTYFRPFSTSPVTFMESSQAAKDRQSLVKAKVNINSTQGAGTYQTVLRFIAVPKY